MADLEQWVNVTRDSKWFGDGLDDLERTTETVKVTIQFTESEFSVGFLSVTPGPKNVTYTATEIPRRNAKFTLPNYKNLLFITGPAGKFEFKINVGPAGGNDFTISVKDFAGKEIQSDVVKTRRKLYFQIIKMSNVSVSTSSAVSAMQSEFWNVPKRVYLKVVEYASGKTIAPTVLYDRTRNSQRLDLFSAARAVYDNSKAPNAFVAVMVNKIGDSSTFHIDVPATLGKSDFTLDTGKVLMDAADPGVSWYKKMVWTRTGKRAKTIKKWRCKRSGNGKIVIDTTGLVKGAGRITADVVILSWSGAGLSYPGANITVIGTKYTISGSFSSSLISGTMVHEFGHKIGMVPGNQSDRVLDVQTATHYFQNGDHCGHGVAKPYPTTDFNGASGISPDCTMFGKVVSSSFCEDCLKSVRKLDLRGGNNRGLRTQF